MLFTNVMQYFCDEWHVFVLSGIFYSSYGERIVFTNSSFRDRVFSITRDDPEIIRNNTEFREACCGDQKKNI